MIKKGTLVPQPGSEVFLATHSRFGSKVAVEAERIPVHEESVQKDNVRSLWRDLRRIAIRHH